MRLVIVIGARPQINRAVRERGAEPQYAHGYRVTDPASLQVGRLGRKAAGDAVRSAVRMGISGVMDWHGPGVTADVVSVLSKQ